MSDDDTYSAAAAEIRSYVERAEMLQEEIADLKGLEKEVFAEAKGRGFDVAALRKIIALRKKDADTRAEEEAVLTMYLAALGMA